jgi:gamma-D-glutamyl-L-lysine dipeptidyl-peptidase
MKKLYKQTGIFILLLFAMTSVMAQTFSYNSLSQELLSLQKQFVPDKRLAVLKIELKDTLQPKIVVTGETDQPDAKDKIIAFLNEKKFSFIDSIRILPDYKLGDKTWALATLSVSNIRILPDDASELVSQVMMGTPLKVLDYIDKWYRVQTPEHYIGWMDTAGLQQMSAKQLEQWKKSDRYLFNHLTGYAFDAPGLKGNMVTDLVLGDLFEVESAKWRFFKIKIPDGRSGYIRKKDCISYDRWINSEPNIKNILSVSRQMMGFPYLWGGTSSKAVDCSGFVKLVFYTQGIVLARDASQQARYGDSIDYRNMKNLQEGDLLFFGSSSQHISHVGIYLGKGSFIHASGKVHISSIDPGDPDYVVNRKNVAACRILNSKNTEGIVRVKDHPWYTILP